MSEVLRNNNKKMSKLSLNDFVNRNTNLLQSEKVSDERKNKEINNEKRNEESNKERNEERKNKVTLVCPGGGCRGKITTSFLNTFERDMFNQRLLKGNDDINKFFNGYAGTSTGALIVSGLANNYSARYIDNYMYSHDNMKRIFSKTWKSYIGKRKYNPKYLYRMIDLNFNKLKIYDIKKPLTIVTFNYTKNKPVVFTNSQNYSQNYSQNSKSEVPLSSILKASSAAPTYFPAIKIDDTDDYYIDGTVCCNNPSTIAINSVESSYGTRLTEGADNTILNFMIQNTDIEKSPRFNGQKILFVGNGISSLNSRTDNPKNYGSVDWFLKGNIFDILMNADEDFNRLETEKILNENYLHINTNLTNPEQGLIDNLKIENYQSLEALGITMYYDNKEKLHSFIFN